MDPVVENQELSNELIARTQEYILLDSNRMCFFCLKEITPVQIKTEEGNTPSSSPYAYSENHCRHHFPLRNISRFLNFKEQEISMCKNGIVETCKECFKLTDEFTELYKTMEMIQLRINWCLRKVCDVMRNAEENKKGDEVEDSRSKNIANLRRKTIINGRKIIRKTTQPLVSLKRMRPSCSEHENGSDDDGDGETPPKLDGPYYQHQTVLENGDHVKYPTLKKGKTVEVNQRDHSHHSSLPQHVEPTISIQKHNSKRKKEEPIFVSALLRQELSSVKRDHLSCPFCRAVFLTTKNTMYIQQSHLSSHILQYHCEHYFPNQKLGTVSDSQYQQILVDLLFNEFCVEKINHFNCPFCPSAFKSTEGKNKYAPVLRLKMHLLNKHREELDVRLLQIQLDPGLSEKLRTCNTKGVRCSCGVYLANSKSEDKHRKLHCTVHAQAQQNQIEIRIPSDVMVEPQPVKLNCDKCGLKNLSLEMLELHKRNQCIFAKPGAHSPSRSMALDLDNNNREAKEMTSKSIWENDNNETLMLDFNFSESDEAIDPLA